MTGKRPLKNLYESSSDDIGHLVVGDGPCTFVEVRDVLCGCASTAKLWPKLIHVARSLQIPTDSIISLEKRIKNDTITYPGALLEILEAWRGKFSAEAKLHDLINVLEINGLADCADALRMHFNVFDDDETSDPIVPYYLKSWMNNKMGKFKRNEVEIDFEELTRKIAAHVDKPIHERPAETQGESVHLLVVGDESFPIRNVLDVIHRHASDDELLPKLQDIARDLDLSDCTKYASQIFLNMNSCKGALFEILRSWRSKSSHNAKLHNLIKALEINGFNYCADELRIKFKEFDDDYVVASLEKLKRSYKLSTWDKLPGHLKDWMNSKAVEFQGKQVKLKQLTALISFPVDEKILDELSIGKTPCIVSDQVPKHLVYYVHRTVESRYILDIDVLKEKYEDVFVIEGVEKSQLTSLVPEDESTDVSGKQRYGLNVRFILLEHPHESDFTKICQLSSNPVHWLKYKNGRLEFVKSSGPVVNLQKHVNSRPRQYSFPEENLSSRPERVIIVADSPGMGKTCLLANIAHQIMRDESTKLVRFIVLKEFADSLAKQKIDTESIVKQIAEQSSEYEFGKKLVENALKTEECVLLFDGLDEVLPIQMPTAKKILQAAVELRKAKVFVATRPHLRDEMENQLHVLSYTMQPFDEVNQIKFLIKFWKMKIKGVDLNDSLTKFTYGCVKQLSAKMTDSERTVAGIPLQCRMLAEVYEEHVSRCSELEDKDYTCDNSIVMIDSMFNLYKRHMDLRFEKIQQQESLKSLYTRLLSFLNKSNQYETIKQAHMYFALKLLFPEHAVEFKHLNPNAIPLNELCGVGILEATNSNDIRFVHRTFAEFLFAWLVHEIIIKKSQYQHVFKTTFHLSPQNVHLYTPFGRPIELESFKFDSSVICYFLNGFAKNPHPATIDYHKEALPFYIASAYHNYEVIPKIVTHPVSIFPNEESYLRNLLYVIAQNSCFELMKAITSKIDITKIDFSKNVHATSGEFVITPLHVAIERGDYTLVEHLLKKYKDKASHLRYLIHFCVNVSAFDSNSVVKDKVQIMKTLIGISNEWIDEQLLDQSTPLMQYYIHSVLLEYLIQEANLDACDEDGNTVLHRITERNRWTGESYDQLVNALNKRGFRHFNKPNKQHITPLHIAICAMKDDELLESTLTLFESKGADLNAVDEEGDSVLFYAIREKSSVELIRKMISLGAETKHRNQKGENILHISAQQRNLNAWKFFIETQNINVIDQDANGKTPLHLAVCAVEDEELLKSTLTLFASKGADLNAVDKRGDSVLFYAIREKRSVELMRKMINLGAETKHRNKKGENILHISAQQRNLNAMDHFINTNNVNDPDADGNTPLHHAVLESRLSKETEAIQLLLIKANANVNAVNKLNRTPFERGEGLSLTVIKEMESNGLNITKAVASTALTTAFLRLETISHASAPLDVLEYLIYKGGSVDFDLAGNFWKWEKVKKAMPVIIQHTVITLSLLTKAKELGLLTEPEFNELQKEDESGKSEEFFRMVQDKPVSFERVYIILRSDQQTRAVEELRNCLRNK